MISRGRGLARRLKGIFGGTLVLEMCDGGLPERVDELVEMNVDHVTITINMVDPEIGAKIYPWIAIDRRRYTGVEASRLLHERQMLGLEMLIARGILVKVNSVMIPGINDEHLEIVNAEVKKRGAFLHNIMPLISDPAHGTHFGLVGQRGPTPAELMRLQGACESGTNPGGVYRDRDGARYYVKSLESPAHARNEYLAAKLYQLAGAPTLDYVSAKEPNQVATEFIDLEERVVAHLGDDERRQARRWLGVHAWTANWDAAGFDGDNQGVVRGVVTTLDVGGALEFRAQGYPKGRAFGTSVGEIDMLRGDADNPHAVRLFGGMSPAEINEAIAVVVGIPDVSIRKLVVGNGGTSELAEKMIARKADMARRMT